MFFSLFCCQNFSKYIQYLQSGGKIRMEEEEKEDKGFVVRDKRHFFQQEGKRPAGEEEKGEKPEADKARVKAGRRKKKEEKEAERKEETREEGKAEEKEGETREVPLPEVTFSNFVFSLSTQALIQLGEIQDPATRETMKSLPLAKQTIDLIGMLGEKTKGNLTKEEETLIETALYDLRMRYVKALG
jgi:hypothetical protein